MAILLCCTTVLLAQAKRDSTSKKTAVSKKAPVVDTAVNKEIDSAHMHTPHKAIIRSAMVPGWGQFYNKKYWKVPLVYGALGITTYVFFDNVKWYHRLRYAYTLLYNKDTAKYSTVYERLQPIVENGDLNTLRNNRDEYRRNVDYSVLVFVLFWGINVVDAAVDAHLQSFDVSPDLSLKLKAGYSEMANTNGLSLILTIK